ncbi:MAG TPA: tRNA (guanosine(46)-N7)-methyltransferase TrmB [Lentimicrobium sp.]|nr:tRNA (guanosine(46)-N7)-methyltransferase TrmB [Lentimicrobium sp.]
MPKKKHARFAENLTFPHLFQVSFEELQQKDFEMKGKWRQFFGNDNPIILELGCGKGEYIVALSARYPEKNFIGIDIKGARMWRGAKTTFENNIRNAAFIRTRIDQIECLFEENEIDGIWITFPDPQPAKARKRLTSPMFLNRYKKFLKPDSIIHLKTDNTDLFTYTLEVIAQEGYALLFHTFDLYNNDLEDDVMLTQTHYEKLFLEQGVAIKYLRFTMT